ncbi:MAG: hypothetical protein JW908_17005 [Anaerolineales bacterium]|nr:hypothetical protein [Anaerolineales bacterium]
MNHENNRKTRKRQVHFINEDGMVACNPGDIEAANRAQDEGIATTNVSEVTCKKCIAILYKLLKEGKNP